MAQFCCWINIIPKTGKQFGENLYDLKIIIDYLQKKVGPHGPVGMLVLCIYSQHFFVVGMNHVYCEHALHKICSLIIILERVSFHSSFLKKAKFNWEKTNLQNVQVRYTHHFRHRSAPGSRVHGVCLRARRTARAVWWPAPLGSQITPSAQGPASAYRTPNWTLVLRKRVPQ